MRLLRSRPDGLVRLQAAACARSVMRRHADFPGIGGEAAGLPSLWQGEARAARLSGGQSALQQARCLLCRPSLPVDTIGKALAVERIVRKTVEPLALHL